MHSSRMRTVRCSSRQSVADPGFPRGGGANSPRVAPTYEIAKFSEKLHEIERIWTPRGGVHPSRPPHIRECV